MGQPFNIKQHEQNERRKPILKQYQQLPYSVRNNILTIIGIDGKRSDYFQTCISCEHWESIEALDPKQPPVERCKKFNILPPGAVIADGCESYTDFDEIPF